MRISDWSSDVCSSDLVTRSITGSISGVDDNISAYVKAGTQNRRLRNELADARRKLVATSALQEENRQLKSLLKLQQTDKAALAHGYLLTSTSTSSRRIALLSIDRKSTRLNSSH